MPDPTAFTIRRRGEKFKTRKATGIPRPQAVFCQPKEPNKPNQPKEPKEPKPGRELTCSRRLVYSSPTLQE